MSRFGIYVHIPFCIHKCSYCDFYSFTKYSEDDFQKFSDALVREIQTISKEFTHTVDTVFFGGGTPSLLPVRYLNNVFEALHKAFTWRENIEITLEANPETITSKLLDDYRRDLPINRISLGAQSFSETNLETLERLCKPEKIAEAADLLLKYGYENFNLDLIFGIGKQPVGDVVSDIQKAIALKPAHISFYNLTLYSGHKLYSQLPTNDESAELFETGIATLENAGYEQYEVSNFSRPGRECRHNLLYWDGGDYLGFGPSSASRYYNDDVFYHQKRAADYLRYLTTEKFEMEFEPLSVEQTRLEALMMELRKKGGIVKENFSERYKIEFQNNPKFSFLQKQGLIEESQENIWLSKKGLMLADRIAVELS